MGGDGHTHHWANAMNMWLGRTDGARAYSICSLMTLLSTLTLSVFVAYRIFGSRDRFDNMFGSLDVQLPWPSVVVLSSWYAWLIPTLAALSIAKELLIKDRRISLICNGIHLFSVIVLWQLYVDGVMAPLIHLIFM